MDPKQTRQHYRQQGRQLVDSGVTKTAAGLSGRSGERSLVLDELTGSGLSTDEPTRSGVSLFANHFRVESYSERPAYKYSVSYRPDVEDSRLREKLLAQHQTLLGTQHIFDGNSVLLLHRLEKKRIEVVSTEHKDKEVKYYELTLELSKELHPTEPDRIRYYNVLFRRILKSMNFKQFGRYYYKVDDPSAAVRSKRLRVWPGYVTSILQHENSITLCMDVNHKLVRQETALDLINRVRNSHRDSVEQWKKLVAKELIGSIVLTEHNNRTYRVDGIDWTKNPKSQFRKANALICYSDYYYNTYGINIKDMEQPLLISKGKWKKSFQGTPQEPIQLVPELCTMTGLTREMRHNSEMMKDLTVRTRLKPEDRRKEMSKLMKSIHKWVLPSLGVEGESLFPFLDLIIWKYVYTFSEKTYKEQLQNWDLTFDIQLLSFRGKTLNTFFPQPVSRSHSGPARESRQENPPHWLFLYTDNNVQTARPLKTKLLEEAAKMNMDMHNVRELVVRNTVRSYINTIQAHHEGAVMVVCVLDSNKKDVYDLLKRYLCVHCPIPSQCVVASTIRYKNLDTIATKIAQQIKCKMGGTLWKVDIGLQNIMFIGIDCFHDIVNRQKSIAGFVASLNQDATQWFSKCILQESGEELVQGLKSCLQASLEYWLRKNQCLPSTVVVYRDGVGDGQLQALTLQEIPQLEKCLKSFDNADRSTTLKLTFIVVKKRINTRLFAKDERGMLTNPNQGTVADTEVTNRKWFDFFIVSQQVSDGTVTPTHYNIIHDTHHFLPNDIQDVTYKLCHMYYNMEGAIRVPAPCHYAHKLAYLVGQSIHQEPDSTLADRLFYL
ncbi:piwi-like protein 3 [Erinaceus europaeus]|uniref:Piwi-like protein 3 n=1 Tax=Erinaceus europaeus TaxID=9365 RepID=A0A1S3WE49_ERIEU|nr:piwi-like protein 3 [Erinaceus europaeus]